MALLPCAPTHYGIKHLQQEIESEHFRFKGPMPRVDGFRSFHTVRHTIQDSLVAQALGCSGACTMPEQKHLLASCFELPVANKK